MKQGVILLTGLVVALGLANTASAIPPFFNEFKAKYLKEEGKDEEKALVALVNKVKCDVCHGKNDKGKPDKKVRNTYGKALDELLDKKTDSKDKEKIVKALDTVAEMKISEDSESPTFGELLLKGKLPLTEEEAANANLDGDAGQAGEEQVAG